MHGQAVKSGNAGAPDCAVCHGSAHELLKPKSQAFRTAVPDTCGMCHTEVVEQFRASVHGQALARGVTQAPLCTDCHGEHNILKHTNAASPVNAANIRETCGSCHGDVRLTRKFGLPADRMVSFDSSFHGLAAKAGSQTVANCASCHGVHNILASSDPKSTINAKNLPTTCGQCHPGAGQRFAIGQVHVTEGGQRAAPTALGAAVLPAGDPGDDRAHAAAQRRRLGPQDWCALRAGTASGRASAAPDGHREMRMLPLRAHAARRAWSLSFIVLVWTGFALKYPDQWWARPLLLWEADSHARPGAPHRGGGLHGRFGDCTWSR